MAEKNLKEKSIVMIIAFRDFRDAEYFVPKEILEEAGVEVKTASNKLGVAVGADGCLAYGNAAYRSDFTGDLITR